MRLTTTFSACLAFLLMLLLLGSGPGASGPGGSYSVTVTAGGFDRTGTVVSFTLPDAVEPGIYEMTRPGGPAVPLQVDRRNAGWFILGRLPAGASRTWRLDTAQGDSRSPGEGVTQAADRRTITFTTRDRPVLSFYHGPNDPPETMDPLYRRGGYIHPAYSPGGLPLTNHLDQQMHPHHYGIWSAWTHTAFQGRTPDFWNVQDSSGRVDHADSLQAAWSGPVQGGLRTLNRYIDLSGPEPVIALNEEWQIRVYNTPAGSGYHMFDLVLTHTVNTSRPLRLPEYRYGGLAVRGHAAWDDPAKVSFLTSEGHDRSNGNATRARWAHMGGEADGRHAGIAVLGHPGNFRAPQPVRIHPDIPYFVFTPQQLGDMSIRPGSPYVMRYRFITRDGPPDPELLDRLWRDYAYPPGVSVTTH